MYLIGHTDPTLTMRVYQQVLDMGGTAPDQLEELLGCTVDEASTLLSGREVAQARGSCSPRRSLRRVPMQGRGPRPRVVLLSFVRRDSPARSHLAAASASKE
jgi:hypothetical protein